MSLEFLVRVRRTTLWVGAIGALFTATYRTPLHGLAVALGAVWSLVNLWLLEQLIVALTGPDRRERSMLQRAVWSLAGMLGLFGAGGVLLATLPPVTLLAGFLLPFAVLVLKAAALLILGSRGWQRFAGGGGRSVRPLVVIVLAVLAFAPLLAAAAAQEHGSSASSPASEHAADAPAGAEHGDSLAHGAGAHGSEHGQSQGPQKFANFITVLSRAFPDASWAQFLHHYEIVIFSLLIAALICLIAALASRNPKMVPTGLQNVVELLVQSLNDFILGILGPKQGPRFVPFLGTLFIYILVMNLFGLIPFMDSPTSSLNVTVALALVVFFYAQYIGVRELGIVGYIDHLAGNPRTAISWALVPLMLPIHVMGELAKPISLSCRLFGNIFGEDMLLVAFVTLGITTLSFLNLPLGLPLQLPFLFLALLTGTLQALVFTVLSTIYILLMLPHDEHGHEEETQHAH